MTYEVINLITLALRFTAAALILIIIKGVMADIGLNKLRKELETVKAEKAETDETIMQLATAIVKLQEVVLKTQFVTVWDGGETKIFCDCQIDPETERVSIVPEKRTIIGPYPEETVDDMVETLDEEYVLMNGSYKIPVYRDDDGEYYVKEGES